MWILITALWAASLLVPGHFIHRANQRAEQWERIALSRDQHVKELRALELETYRALQEARGRARETRSELTVERAYSAACDREFARLRDELVNKALLPTLAAQDVEVQAPSLARGPRPGFVVSA